MYAIIKNWQLSGFTDVEITEENMSFDELIEWDFDTTKNYTFDNWEVIENIEIIDKKQKDIDLFKSIEKQATEKRSQYLTAQLLPEWEYKDLKLEKLDEEWEELTLLHSSKLEELKTKYGEEILNELI